MVSPLLRAVFRRSLDVRRLPAKTPRRFQSSGPQRPPTSKKTEDAIPVPNTVAPLPFWQRLGPLTRAAKAYARAQRMRPWTTQVASTLFIYLCADMSAQRIGGKEYDPKRTVRSLIIGAVAAIPSYTWFMFLSRNFNYASRLVSIATKVTINQICFTPIFNTYFFGSQALLSGESLPDTWERIKRTVPVSFANSLKLWPAVTAFSFTFIPIEYRSIFAGVIAVGWQTYLSFLNRQAETAQHGKDKVVTTVKPQEVVVAVPEKVKITA